MLAIREQLHVSMGRYANSNNNNNRNFLFVSNGNNDHEFIVRRPSLYHTITNLYCQRKWNEFMIVAVGLKIAGWMEVSHYPEPSAISNSSRTKKSRLNVKLSLVRVKQQLLDFDSIHHKLMHENHIVLQPTQMSRSTTSMKIGNSFYSQAMAFGMFSATTMSFDCVYVKFPMAHHPNKYVKNWWPNVCRPIY